MVTDPIGMNALLELAARVEAATGPDFAIDAAIAVAVVGYTLEKRGRDQKAWYYHPTERRRSASQYSGFDRLPRYTDSLDAAMTLVPEGWFFHVSRFSESEMRGNAHVYGNRGLGDDYESDAATPALALTAAALRSRAHGGE